MSPDDRTSPVAQPSTVALRTAGKRIELLFAAELEELANEIRTLWAHVRDDAGSDTDGQPADQESSEVLTIAFTATDDINVTAVSSHRLTPENRGNNFIVSGRVTISLIRDLIGKKILLHAGATALPNLGTVIVVGASGAGKSTATTALGQHGEYLTDELTILDPDDFSLTAFPKPISRVLGSETVGEGGTFAGDRNKVDVELHTLGLRPGSTSDAPSHILLLDRQNAADVAEPADGEHEGSSGDMPVAAGQGGAAAATAAGPAAPRVSAARASTVDALHALVGQSSSTWLVDQGLTRLMHLLDHCGGALTVRYREATDLADALPTLVQTPPQRQDWRSIVGRAAAPPSAGQYAVTPFRDAVALDESLVILRNHLLVSTQGLSATVWDILELCGPLIREQLVKEVEDRLGENPQADELLDDALTSLVGDGLIVLGM